MYVILAILIFGFLIFIHELGHFLVARMCGVQILEFAIGMGPKLLSKKSKKSGTVYSLRLFPLGGFVSMLGENGMEAVQGENGEGEAQSILINNEIPEEAEDQEPSTKEPVAQNEDPRSYSNQSVWKRILISVAGPLMNLLLGLVLMLVFVIASASQGPLGSNRVAAFYVTYTAEEAHHGLQAGDYIVGIDNLPVQSYAQLLEHVENGESGVFSLVIARAGEENSIILNDVPLNADLLKTSFDYSRSEQCGLKVNDQIIKVNKTPIHTQNELWYEVMNQGYRPFSLTVIRDGERLVLENVIVPTFEDSGSVFGDVDFQVWAEKPMEGHSTMPGVGVLLKHTWFLSVSTVKMVYDSLGGLFSGRFGVEAVSGPVGITQTITTVAKTGLLNVLYLVIVISINLGIMNLLPVPGLDGGHLLIYFVEVIRRKPMKKELEGVINFVGLIILLTLAVLIAIKDIINL
ncbi:MAG: RIP metalloprotease RseP [Clostridia bacterium]|nr:RIP metalloprotease RseP [Clostridia bacterium]